MTPHERASAPTTTAPGSGATAGSGTTSGVTTPPAMVRVARGGRSLLLHRRSILVTAVLVAVTLAAAVVAMSLGAYRLTPAEVVEVLLGGGSSLDRVIVVGQRLPRTLAAILVGAALGASGALFQSLSRNALGSPDIVGFTTGASTGGLVALLVVGSPTTGGVVLGALVGGVLTAAAVVVLSAQAALAGERLVLGGIAIGTMLAALNDYLISRAPLESAEAARAWEFGSLNAVTWKLVGPLVVVAVVLLALLPLAVRPLQILDLGDDSAAGLGLDRRRTRLGLLALGVALCAGAVAVSGPIGFLALAAPHLARRLAPGAGAALIPSAAMGACLLLLADIAAQRLLAPFQIPVGLVSSALGGLYLVWFLTVRSGRR